MPGEVNPYNSRVGFIEIRWVRGVSQFRLRTTTAHEFQHLIHDLVDRNERSWLNESLAVFSQLHVGDNRDPEEFASAFFNNAGRVQLNPSSFGETTYGAAFLFLTYLQDRFGLETLQAFAAHPENGLDALDALFAEIGVDVDADTFFADWILANYLNNAELSDGRYGYPLLSKLKRSTQPYAEYFRNLPIIFRRQEPQYFTRYYKFELPTIGQTRQLELQLDGPLSQDAWLQLVQISGGQITLDRYRASDFRDQPIAATLNEGAEHVFLSISPFTPNDRENDTPVRYTLSIRTLVSNEAILAPDHSLVSPSIKLLDRAEFTDLMRAAAGGDAIEVNRIYIDSANRLQPMEMIQALHLAAAAGYEDVVALFILTDIDIQAQDTNGQSALMLAEEAGHDRIVELLRVAAAEEDKRAQQRIAPEEVRDFLISASDNDPNIKAQTLTEAAGSGFTNLIHLLLTLRNLDLDIDLIDLYGETALMAATRVGHADTVTRLSCTRCQP